MPDAQAEDNVVALMQPKPDSEPTERDLVMRLLELLDAREAMQERVDEHMHGMALVEEEIDSAGEEIAAIKRKLGDSVKGRRRSRPTRAAASGSGSSQTLTQRALETMKKREWWTPPELFEVLGLTSTGDKQTVRQCLKRRMENKTLKRKRVGTTRAGHPAYAYSLKK